MSGYISKLIEGVLHGLQEADNKIMDYLLLKGSYIQPLRLALHVSKKGSDSALYNTLSPFLLESRYIFDEEYATASPSEFRSLPLSTERISIDTIVLPPIETPGIGQEESIVPDQLQISSESFKVKSAASENIEQEFLDEEILPSKSDFTQKKGKKKKKDKKKKHWVDDVENSPYIVWLKQQKTLGAFPKNAKIKKPNKFKKILESAQKSVTPSHEIISEPLAKLLLSQGHFLEAKKMYKSLMIKFPELGESFQREIKEINKLIDPGKN